MAPSGRPRDALLAIVHRSTGTTPPGTEGAIPVKPNRSRRDPTSAAAAATRRWRERKAEGRRVVPLDMFEQEIQELVRLGYLRGDHAHDPGAIADALGLVLEAMCRR